MIVASCIEMTFVLATPISGPALMCTPQYVPRLMELPTVLVIPTTRAPLRLQYCRAFRVSAVSPERERERGREGEGEGGRERGREGGREREREGEREGERGSV